jgi:hypothetical protein
MKTVFSSNSDCIHAFAQRNQSHGRCGNLFFKHDAIYSYGYHYELARFIDAENILINNRGYSNSTAKHISATMQATRQYKQWYTMSTDPQLVEYQLNDFKKSLLKAKKPEKYLIPALNLIEKYNEYGQRFGYSYQSDRLLELIQYFGSDFSDIQDRIKENIQAEKAKKERLLIEYKKAFYNFEPFEGLRNQLNLDYDLIRLNGENIETSQNVRVSFTEAKNLFKRFLNGENIRGEKIGYYTITKADPDSIRIGCHNLKPSDIAPILI